MTSATQSSPQSPGFAERYRRFAANKTFLFPLLLLILVVLVNYSFQDNMLTPRVLNANLRSFTPLIFLAVAQSLVILSGSIDLSIGVIMSLAAAVMVTQAPAEATGQQFIVAVLLGIGVGLAAGALNGILASYVRLPSFITTYSTSYVFAGIALWVLPRPGGNVPTEIGRAYRSLMPAGIPLGIYVIIVILVLWQLFRWTRFGAYLYAIGGSPRSAFASGVPVASHRFVTHMLAGGIAAVAALFFVLNTGSSDARIGASLTLDSIVAVVLGGTPMSGGLGGVAGSIMGVLILGFVRNIVSFADVNTWLQSLVDAGIILVALVSPGAINLIRRQLTRRPGS
jgi:ribose transport system permease protein